MSGLATGDRVVPAEWIDYNGHMMDAYYFVAFTEATEALLDYLGLGAAYQAQSGSGIYTAESHLRFRQSVRQGARLRYESQLLGHDQKRLHVVHRMMDADTGAVVATCESMFLHVHLASEKVTAMPADRSEAVTRLAAAHAHVPDHPRPFLRHQACSTR